MARGLLIENATVGLVKSGTGFALDASGAAAIVGLDGVTVGGTVRVRYNTLTASTGTPLQRDHLARHRRRRRCPVRGDRGR